MRLHRLSAAPLLLALAISPLAARAHAATDPDLIEIQHYTLTMDKVNRFYDSMKELSDLSSDHQGLKDKLETDSDHDKDIAAMERRISSEPLIVSTISKHGYTPHEFVVFEMTFIQTVFDEAMMKQPGADRAKMKDDGHVNPANIAFVEQHQAELQALQQKYQPEKKKRHTEESSGSEDNS